MTTTHVVNLYRTPYDVYIGRPGKGKSAAACPWGNPFTIGPDGTRDGVIAKYEQWLQTQPQLLARLPELRGKRLGCFCAPQPCHGDVLARLADATPIEYLGDPEDRLQVLRTQLEQTGHPDVQEDIRAEIRDLQATMTCLAETLFAD